MADDPALPPSWNPSQWDDYISSFQSPVNLQAPLIPVTPVAAPQVDAVTPGPDLPPTPEPTQDQQATPPVQQLLPQQPTGLQTPPLLGSPAPDVATAPPPAPNGVDQVLDFAKLKTPPVTHDEQLTPEQLGARMAEKPQEEQALFHSDLEQRRQDFANKRLHEELDRNRQALIDNQNAFNARVTAAQQHAAQLDADAKQLADQTPMDELTGGQKLASVILGIVGGFAAINAGKAGQNLAADSIAQIANDAAKRHAEKMQVNARQRAAVGEEINDANAAYHVAETVRLATYDSAIKSLESEVQAFDPRGTTADRIMTTLTQVKSMRAQALEKVASDRQAQLQKGFDNQVKLGELGLKVRAEDRADKKEAFDEAKAGVSTAAKPEEAMLPNPAYPFATSLHDPFTKQPLGAASKLDKGMVDKLHTELTGYYDEQRAWAKLKAIAKRLDGHRSSGGQVWDRWKTTDEREYEAARSALLTHKIKMLGERPNEQAIHNQENLVPDLQKAMSASDTVKMLDDAQSDNDATFAGHLNVMGADGDSVIASAQRHRASAPEPKLDEEITSATEAAARASHSGSPTAQKDAMAAVQEAESRSAELAAEKQKQAAAIKTANGLAPIPLANENPDDAPEVQARFKAVNDARDTYNKLLRSYHDLLLAKTKPSDEALGAAAAKVVDAKGAVDMINTDNVSAFNSWGGGPKPIIDTKFH